MKRALLIILLGVGGATSTYAQSDKLSVTGDVQSDILIPQNDDAIGAERGEAFQTNTYAGVQLTSRYADAGLRLAYLQHPLPGYEKDFKGWGLPYFFAKGKLKQAELTAGTFYEQFGSGFILRTYEERSLGIDNSLLGGRLMVKPVKGLTLKVLSGVQRRYWKWNKALISGADAEWNIDELIPSWQMNGTSVLIGGSWVNRYEDNDAEVFADATHKVNFPKFVNAWDVRVNVNHGAWNILAEYAGKTDDPSYANGYIFRKGSAVMLSCSYAANGLSVLVQAKRSENMSFKSTGDPAKAIGTSSYINHLPSFTQDHTYALAALYPYATQLADGEWAYQATLSYNFKRHTPLGGKYGMSVTLNGSYVRGIQRDFVDGNTYNTLTGSTVLAGTDGYSSSFFGWGDQTFYHDVNIQLSRKLSKNFKLFLMYMNQRYNQTIVEGHGGVIHSNIIVADAKYQFSPKVTLRGELQYLNTPDDQGDWLYGLLELSLAPHWMVTVSDMYNVGVTGVHYYQGLVTFNIGAHRLQAGYGRTRAGFNCSGGVCRYVPATKGFSLSYNYNF